MLLITSINEAHNWRKINAALEKKRRQIKDYSNGAQVGKQSQGCFLFCLVLDPHSQALAVIHSIRRVKLHREATAVTMVR